MGPIREPDLLTLTHPACRVGTPSRNPLSTKPLVRETWQFRDVLGPSRNPLDRARAPDRVPTHYPVSDG